MAGSVAGLGVVGLILLVPCLCGLGFLVYSTDSQDEFPFLGAVTGAAMGLVLLAVMVYFGFGLIRSYVRMWRLRIRGVTISATVVRPYVQEGHSDDGGDTFRAVIRVDGADVSTDVITSGPLRTAGDRLRVRYDPKDPANSIEVRRTVGGVISSIFVEAVMLTLVLGIVGLFVGLGVALYEAVR